ncbi:MAG: hypothetical protein M1826_003689 [Phylliscum demangeonii]|nr:MAG: hypothetical protein M1826_003689 [Phylliscum demangeonii]
MTPPVESFPASALPQRVQLAANGRARKDQPPIDLKACDLLEIVQYDCQLVAVAAAAAGAGAGAATTEEDVNGRRRIVCAPVTRLFRR